jgi:uncharacterized membrane protein YiaA
MTVWWEAAWQAAGTVVMVLGLLLALWLLFTTLLEGSGHEEAWASLCCLVASVAIILTMVGFCPGPLSWAAAGAFVVAAVLCFLAQWRWRRYSPWSQAASFETNITVLLALDTRWWRRP